MTPDSLRGIDTIFALYIGLSLHLRLHLRELGQLSASILSSYILRLLDRRYCPENTQQTH